MVIASFGAIPRVRSGELIPAKYSPRRIQRTLSPRSSVTLFVDVKLVQEAMDDGREHDSHYGDEDQSAEERVERSKDFYAVCRELIDRAHAAENHRRLQQ